MLILTSVFVFKHVNKKLAKYIPWTLFAVILRKINYVLLYTQDKDFIIKLVHWVLFSSLKKTRTLYFGSPQFKLKYYYLSSLFCVWQVRFPADRIKRCFLCEKINGFFVAAFNKLNEKELIKLRPYLFNSWHFLPNWV